MNSSLGKRVLMLLENSSYPGDDRPRREAETLVRAGYEVSVICPAWKDEPRREILRGVHVYRYRPQFSTGGMSGYLWEYGWALAVTFLLSLLVFWQRRFDVIHAHNPPDLFVLIALFYKPLRKRFVFDHHDLAPEMYRARFGGGSELVYRVLAFFERLSCRVADHVIATNESYKSMEIQRSGIPADRITVVRNGPDLSRVKATTPDPDLRAKATTIFGYVGVMGHQDGVDYLLRALRHLRYDLQRTDFYCIALGAGDALESLKTLARELGVENHIHFTGFITDAPQLMRYLCAADIGVDPDPSNPYNDRSTMIKLMEYMALSKPVVAFDLPEHRVTAEGAALYAQANDERDFAVQLAALMDDPKRRAAMGRLGRRRIESHLSWSHQEAHLLAAYETICAPRRSAETKGDLPKHKTPEPAEPIASRVY